MRHKWILVVDDDPDTVGLLPDGLEAAHYRVTIAQDALEACIQAEALKPALILLDYLLPNFGSGADVIRRLRANPHLKDIPVIVVTGMDAGEVRAALPSDPRVWLMPKPPDWGEILQAARTWAA